MALDLSERAKALLFASILIASIGGLYAAAASLQPPLARSQAILLPRLEIDGSGWSVDYRPTSTVNNTVFLLLLEASATLHFSVQYEVWQFPQGVLVTAINGTGNGHDRFWSYWVNGQCGTVAADRQAIGNGDRVLWDFTTITCG